MVTLERPALPAVHRRAAIGALPEVRWAAVALALFTAGGAAQLTGAPSPVWWALYLACYVAGGWEPALAGLRALRGRALDVDLLMVVAAIAAAIGQVFDGALLIVIFATSAAVEAVVTRRTEESVRALLDLAPERAALLHADGTEENIPVADLDVGDVVLVRPGERVGADGVVISGTSEVDQASITGEGLPVPKRPGDEVFAGSLNGTGALRVRVERVATESVVARIAAMVREASATKARTQLFVERIEQRYSGAVVVAALALVAIPLAFGAAFEPTLLRAMTFMIVASPCAVVLATMPPLLAAIANGGRRGVLVKSAVAMEALGRTTVVAFDKTGTLTEGRPHVESVTAFDGFDEDTVLALAAAAERPSEHPLAAAVVRAARERGLAVADAGDFGSLPGRGVRATVGATAVVVGSPTMPDADPAISRLQAGGATVVTVTADGRPAGFLALVDRLRPDAADTVARLAELTGNAPVLLTGDHAAAAQRVADAVGITDVRAGLLPDAKAAAVRELQASGHRTLLVGDGVNDAPALATADVGVALGGRGIALAVETADAVIVRDDLITLPNLLGLSRRARRVVLANIGIAATVIAGLVTWDLLGTLPLPLGVAGHEGSTVVVALNGLRLLRAAAWRRAGTPGRPRALRYGDR
ncbi:heavy metal translocating P-type ATPase [Pseudonocardia adelaidensis]|uniref:heavy metal translocating P-type ATPase n=1 Tax=Pseudonocardia adelaidensis TaxID=648754 RepID=UPI0031EBF58C